MKRLSILIILLLVPAVSAQIALDGPVTSSPTVADIDQNPGNGLEIAVGTENQKLYALYQSGANMPGWPKSLTSYKGGVGFSSPAIADLDGNGDYEIVIGNEKDTSSGPVGYLKVYHSSGSSYWSHQAPGSMSGSSPAIADVNKDGKLEIIIGCKDGKLYFFDYDGYLPYLSKSLGGSVSTPAIGDVNSDGNLEIVAASSSGYVYILKADGTELFKKQVPTGTSSPALADLDNDGDLEIIAASKDGKVYAWHGNGNVLQGWPVQASSITMPSPAIGDMDADGDLEVVAAADNNKVYAYHADGTLFSGFPLVAEEKVDARSSAALADLDGDENLEIVFAASQHLFNEETLETTNYGRVYAWYMDGASFTGFPKTTNEWVKSSPTATDIDNDEVNEILIGSDDGNLYIWKGTGTSYNLGWPMFHYNERNTRMYDAPTVQISSPVSGSSHIVGTSISFSAVASDVDGSIASYEWTSSKDGVLSTLGSFSTSGLSQGSHIISLKVIDDENKMSRTSVEITVAENSAPTASIASPGDGSSFSYSDSITFSGSGTDTDGSISAYSWTSSMGGALSSSDSFASSLSIGTHVITFKVTDNNGATGTAQVTITVANNPPTADAGSDRLAIRDQPITFDGSGSSDPEGSALTYSWDFGDGSTGSGVTTTHSYPTLGSYTAMLTVTDEHGESDTDTVGITIYNRAPIAEAGESQSIVEEQAATFDASNSSDPDGDALTYSWDFGDGSTGSGVTATHSYSAGIYTVKLTVGDGHGGSDSDTLVVYVAEKGQEPVVIQGKGAQADLIKKGVTILTPAISRDIIKDLGLRTRQFYDAPMSLIATLALLDEYPAPQDVGVRSILINPVETVTGDVYDLSAEKVLKRYRYTDTLVITRGDLYVDSFAGVAYATSEDLPILLTKPGELPSVVLNAIKKLNPDKIILLGGPVAVSGDVESELGDIAEIQRVWGETRYETAVELANMIGQPETIVITDGQNPSVDAVLMSLSYKAPLLYVKGEEIPQPLKDYLSQHPTAEIILVGVSEDVGSAITDIIGG